MKPTSWISISWKTTITAFRSSQLEATDEIARSESPGRRSSCMIKTSPEFITETSTESWNIKFISAMAPLVSLPNRLWTFSRRCANSKLKKSTCRRKPKRTRVTRVAMIKKGGGENLAGSLILLIKLLETRFEGRKSAETTLWLSEATISRIFKMLLLWHTSAVKAKSHSDWPILL